MEYPYLMQQNIKNQESSIKDQWQVSIRANQPDETWINMNRHGRKTMLKDIKPLSRYKIQESVSKDQGQWTKTISILQFKYSDPKKINQEQKTKVQESKLTQRSKG